MTAACTVNDIQMRAAALVHDAATRGLIVTIERQSMMPPAMGHTQAIIEVRPARELSDETRQYLWQSVKEERYGGTLAQAVVQGLTWGEVLSDGDWTPRAAG